MSTVIMYVYWIYEFNMNEDLTVVSYREFYQTHDDIFPAVSLYLYNSSLKERLSEYGIKESCYKDFLKEEYFSEKMLQVEYRNVIIDISDLIKGHRIYFINSTIIKFDSGLPHQVKKKANSRKL